MKSLQWLLAVFFLFVLTATAGGQSNPAPTAYPPDAPISAMMTSSPFLGGGAGHSVHSVKGSPFSADVDYDFTQILAGENHIHRESHGKIFRDAEGRVRNEIEPETPPGPSVVMTTITINDSVSQTFVTLYPQAKRAVVNHMTVITDSAGRVFGVGVVADSSRATGAITPTELLEQLEQRRALQRAPAPRATERKPTRLKIGGQREELGAKEIEGFTASGIRFTGTTPAGQIGNEKPIVKLEENWWSEDLKAVLVSIYDDPQSGRRAMRLTNIQVGEPDSQLFQIPPDYTVQEFPASSKTAAKPPQ